MIRYALLCDTDHRWEAWFPSSAGFDEQCARKLVACPVCDSTAVRKAVMAPAVVSSRSDRPAPPTAAPVPSVAEGIDLPAPVRAFIEEWRAHVALHYDYVGDAFAEEARAIHEGTSDERLIYGDVTPEDARALVEEGVPVAPLPSLANPIAAKKLI